MENQELMKIVEQYHAYWRTYIQPLADKEPKRYAHFTTTLNEVGKRFYGSEFFLEFCIAVLYSVFEDPAGEPVSDTMQQLELGTVGIRLKLARSCRGGVRLPARPTCRPCLPCRQEGR